MMAKYSSLTVVLEEDLSEERMVPLMAAVGHLRGVLSVKAGPRDVLAEHVATERVRREIGDKLFAIVFPPAAKV
jgi:hypothetical protein